MFSIRGLYSSPAATYLHLRLTHFNACLTYIWHRSNVHIVYTSVCLTYKTHAVIRREFWTCSKQFCGLGAQCRMTAFTSRLLTNTTYAKPTHTLSQRTPPCWWKFTYICIPLCNSSESDRAISQRVVGKSVIFIQTIYIINRGHPYVVLTRNTRLTE